MRITRPLMALATVQMAFLGACEMFDGAEPSLTVAEVSVANRDVMLVLVNRGESAITTGGCGGEPIAVAVDERRGGEWVFTTGRGVVCLALLGSGKKVFAPGEVASVTVALPRAGLFRARVPYTTSTGDRRAAVSPDFAVD